MKEKPKVIKRDERKQEGRQLRQVLLDQKARLMKKVRDIESQIILVGSAEASEQIFESGKRNG